MLLRWRFVDADRIARRGIRRAPRRRGFFVVKVGNGPVDPIVGWGLCRWHCRWALSLALSLASALALTLTLALALFSSFVSSSWAWTAAPLPAPLQAATPPQSASSTTTGSTTGASVPTSATCASGSTIDRRLVRSGSTRGLFGNGSKRTLHRQSVPAHHADRDHHANMPSNAQSHL